MRAALLLRAGASAIVVRLFHRTETPMTLPALLLLACPIQPAAPLTEPAPQNVEAIEFVGAAKEPREVLCLWSRKPATKFTEAYSVGNGRIGATVFGGVANEHIVLNESSLWSGSVQSADRPDSAAKVAEVQKLIAAGKHDEAEKLAREALTCSGAGPAGGKAKDLPFGSYQALADLDITYLDKDGAAIGGKIKDYRNVLDFRYGAQFTTFEYKSRVDQRPVAFVRRMFASNIEDVLVYRIAPDGNHNVNFDVHLTRKEGAKTESVGNDELLLTGNVSDGKGGAGTGFNARIKCYQRGGKVTCENGVLKVRDADLGMLIIGLGTSYSGPVVGPWQGKDHVAITQHSIYQALAKGYELMWKEQTEKHYGPLYLRSTLEFHPHDAPAPPSKIPTLERLTALAKGSNDIDMMALCFMYGRYLMMTGARAGQLPPNSQGLWSDDLQTASNGAYALTGGAPLCSWPMGNIAFTENASAWGVLLNSLVEPGKKTAQAYYGAKKGWVAHGATNVWGFTSPTDDPASGAMVTGGAWLANATCQDFAFTQDVGHIAPYYQAVKGAAEFFLETLVEEPTHKWLVTPVSNAAGLAYATAGKPAHLGSGSALDTAIVRDLFANVAEVARVQSIDLDLAKKLDEARARLAPLQVAGDGTLKEWFDDRMPADPKHAQIGALYGLFPSDQITRTGTPELAKAARATLEKLGDGGPAWSQAWKAACWARLGEGDRAIAQLTKLWTPVTEGDGHVGGSFPNLFAANPGFEIQGNFAATSAMGELLVQSYREKPGEDYTIHLLPALPSLWLEGGVHGILARGGFNVSVHWKDGALESAYIYRSGATGGNVRIRYDRPLQAKVDNVDPGSAYLDGVFVVYLDAHKGAQITPK